MWRPTVAWFSFVPSVSFSLSRVVFIFTVSHVYIQKLHMLVNSSYHFYYLQKDLYREYAKQWPLRATGGNYRKMSQFIFLNFLWVVCFKDMIKFSRTGAKTDKVSTIIFLTVYNHLKLRMAFFFFFCLEWANAFYSSTLCIFSDHHKRKEGEARGIFVGCDLQSQF